MTLKKNFIFQLSVTVLTLVTLTSCDSDANSIGTGIIGSGTFTTNHLTYPVTAYNKPLGAVQTNLLPAYLLGFNNHPIYGSTLASIVSQMTPTNIDPSFGDDVVLDSVVLTLPYFSRIIETLSDGSSLYELDSVYGSEPINLSVYRNNYFLKDFDPASDFDEQLVYYSNRTTSSGEVIDPSLLEGDLLLTVEDLVPSNEQIVLYATDEETNEFSISQRLAPALRQTLDIDSGYWQDFLFGHEDQPELSNISNFQNYFRGLYLKPELPSTGSSGHMALFDLNNSAANLTFYFTYSTSTTVNGEQVLNDYHGTFVMNFNGNKANFFDTNYTNIAEGDPNGDPQLFLKGGPGSMAVVNLFNGDENGNSAILESFKANKWLINEAQLVFNVDQTAVNGGEEPDRIIVYNTETGVPVIDYFIDQSAGVYDNQTKTYHLVPLVREGGTSNGAGQTYKVRITEHVNNIFERDSTNVKLGVVVTSNVSAANASRGTNASDLYTLTGSILSPKGTVLVGSNSSNTAKNIRFEIYYTEPNN